MKLLHLTLLWVGCYWLNLLIFSLLLLIVFASGNGYLTALIFFTAVIFIFISFIYHQHFAKEHFLEYCEMIIHESKKKLDILNSKAYLLTKKGAKCNFLLKNRKTYSIGVVYLSDEFLTYSSKCPPFHMFKLKRADRKRKFAIIKTCGLNKELYYSYIQSVHYNPDDDSLDIVLTSGDVEKIPSEKKDAEKAVTAIREKLRNTSRAIQTNRTSTT